VTPRVYRRTDLLYYYEYGSNIALSRNNRVREYLYDSIIRNDFEESMLEGLIFNQYGISMPIEKVKSGVYITSTRLTEDMAHTIGSKFRIALLSSNFTNQPTIADIEMYKKHKFIV